MKIVDWFKDWMQNGEEKKKFIQAWKDQNPYLSRNWEDSLINYHSGQDYEIYLLNKKIEELEQKIK